jgi:hypothetical protein
VGATAHQCAGGADGARAGRAGQRSPSARRIALDPVGLSGQVRFFGDMSDAHCLLPQHGEHLIEHEKSLSWTAYEVLRGITAKRGGGCTCTAQVGRSGPAPDTGADSLLRADYSITALS